MLANFLLLACLLVVCVQLLVTLSCHLQKCAKFLAYNSQQQTAAIEQLCGVNTPLSVGVQTETKLTKSVLQYMKYKERERVRGGGGEGGRTLMCSDVPYTQRNIIYIKIGASSIICMYCVQCTMYYPEFSPRKRILLISNWLYVYIYSKCRLILYSTSYTVKTPDVEFHTYNRMPQDQTVHRAEYVSCLWAA
jgi:hypothetical protein